VRPADGEGANLPVPNGRAEVARCAIWPTPASASLTGAWRSSASASGIARRGASDVPALRAFHDTLAGRGGLPIALAKRALLG
jgi:hypothetical protein